MEERTGWRGQNESQTGEEEKWQTVWCCRDQQRACRMAQASVEKLEHTENEMTDVLGRVSTGAAGRILDSANPRAIRTQQ